MARKQQETLAFEKSLKELEALVAKMEQGNLSLEESLRDFERGVQLTRACQQALKEAEQKVEILLKKTGQDDITPFASEDT
jgi:exodeoxyribonuclease VII small subunit